MRFGEWEKGVSFGHKKGGKEEKESGKTAFCVGFCIFACGGI